MDIVQKRLIQYPQILQFVVQSTAGTGILCQFLHLLYADAILHKFGNSRLYLMDITDLVQMRAHHFQLFLALLGRLAQYKAFARIIQNRHILTAHLFQNAMGKPAKAEHVYIHDNMIGMLYHQIHLCLHGKLIRHDQEIIGLRILP